jgi:hypothetical protein
MIRLLKKKPNLGTMHVNKKYKDSLLSVLCVISWLVFVIRIFKSVEGDRVFIDLTLTYLITTGVGIVGGISLIFIRILKKRKLKYSFVYNLFGTFNIIVGFPGLAIFSFGVNPSPYIITACLGVGLIMYKDIYRNELKYAIDQ